MSSILDTKEKPFACPYCRRSFQRSDVKAVHVKKCHAAPLDHCNGDSGKEGAARKRVRIACNSCRKRKMRCDGNEPCGPCQSTATICHYKEATASSAHSQSSHNDGAGVYPGQIDDAFEIPIDDDEGSISLPFTVPHTNLSNGASLNGASLNDGLGLEPSLEPSMESIQGTTSGSVPLSFQGHPAMPAYESMNSEVPDMSMSQDNLLYPFPDPSGVNEFWQMPSVVSRVCPVGHCAS